MIAHDRALFEDLGLVVNAVRPTDRPFILLGHSMGGAVVADFVARRVRAADLVVLSSPALKAPLNVKARTRRGGYAGVRLSEDRGDIA